MCYSITVHALTCVLPSLCLLIPGLSLELVTVWLAPHILRHCLPHDGEAQLGGDVGTEKVGLGLHACHDLCPLGHHAVTLALHFAGHGVQEDGVAVHCVSHLLTQEEVMAIHAVPPALVLLARLLGEVTSAAHVQHGLRSCLAAHHGCVDALARQRVDVAGSVSNNEKVVVHCGEQTLATAAQAGNAHTLQLCVGTQCLADEGVLLDCVIVEPCQVSLCHVPAVALLAARNEVIAVVQLIIGVTEDCCIAGQRPLGVEAYAIKVGVVCAALYKGTGAHALGGLSAVPHPGSHF
mmetsp:Transcript_11069/g.19211  ORF Transcript_11069/g.19211 Transcript_11069/m.19211 type:complete len:293 (+) Transcript_11069:419-1297(+)